MEIGKEKERYLVVHGLDEAAKAVFLSGDGHLRKAERERERVENE